LFWSTSSLWIAIQRMTGSRSLTPGPRSITNSIQYSGIPSPSGLYLSLLYIIGEPLPLSQLPFFTWAYRREERPAAFRPQAVTLSLPATAKFEKQRRGLSFKLISRRLRTWCNKSAKDAVLREEVTARGVWRRWQCAAGRCVKVLGKCRCW
jgi:hypothetical protein